jgi:hypothetical protein
MPKLATPLTDEKIAALQPQSALYKIGDGRGLYLVVRPLGSKRWRMIYKRQGKTTSVSFGDYPSTSLSAARQRRDESLQLIANGKDPVEVKREESRQAREIQAKLPKLRFSMTSESGIVIENTRNRLILTPIQTLALREFLMPAKNQFEAE